MKVDIPSKRKIEIMINEKFEKEFDKIYCYMNGLRDDLLKIEEEIKLLKRKK